MIRRRRVIELICHHNIVYDTIGYVDVENDNDVVINDNSLPSGTYTLRYEDESGNPLESFGNIVVFTV